MSTVADEVMVRAFDVLTRGEGDKSMALFDAGAYLLTFGFYLGREHALRGYASPVPRRDVLLPDVPNSLDGWL
jgi:hypothetical protein